MKNPANKRPRYLFTVTQTQQISPSFQRICLAAEQDSPFKAQHEGDYVKLFFTPDGNTDLTQLTEEIRPLLRTYTLREVNEQTGEITLDFVLHTTLDQQCGFAAHWAAQAQVGDTITLAGPGQSTAINLQADWFFLAADMTALPALAATLKMLPPSAQGYAVISIAHPDDQQTLSAPKGIKLIWVVGDDATSFVEQIQAQPWQQGQCAVWCACEFDDMRKLRHYFRNEKSVSRDSIYISSYWKQGVTEDGHKVLKREDAEADSAIA